MSNNSDKYNSIADDRMAATYSDEKQLQHALDAELRDILNTSRPAAKELLSMLQNTFGWVIRVYFREALDRLRHDDDLFRLGPYFDTDLSSKNIDEALHGTAKPDREFQSTLDELFARSRQYQRTKDFQEMIDFVARFRDYAPYNNYLVKVQRPSCDFYATAKDWQKRFKRTIKEDAHPMLILAPMHPVMAVYDLDSTEGPELPKHLLVSAKAKESWKPSILVRTIENAGRDRILVQRKPLSSTHRGRAIMGCANPDYKARVVIHSELSDEACFAALCHELAHIYLGHLGSDEDGWWPNRPNLVRATVEIEAEAVAFIVTSRVGLQVASEKYVSSYQNDLIPDSLSLDLIAKTAAKLEDMGKHARRPRKRKKGSEPQDQETGKA